MSAKRGHMQMQVVLRFVLILRYTKSFMLTLHFVLIAWQNDSLFCSLLCVLLLYRIIHKSLRNFWNRMLNNRYRHSRKDISSTCKVGQKLGVSLPLLTCSPSAWPSRLLYHRGRKSRRDLWITLYIRQHNNVSFETLGNIHITTVFPSTWDANFGFHNNWVTQGAEEDGETAFLNPLQTPL